MTLEKDLKKAAEIAKQTVLENLSLSTLRTGAKNPFGDESFLLDQLAEDKIIELLLASDTSYSVLTEEKGIVESEGHPEYLVILDPVDGSTNLTRGIPIVAIGISAVPCKENMTTNDIEFSIIDSFFTDETYIAVNGKGVTKNGKDIRPQSEKEIPEIIISYNIRKMLEKDLIHKSSQILSSVHDLRRTGCPLLDLCWTASGALDAMIDFRNTLPIVHLSGIHMVFEAGGIVLDLNGLRYNQTFDLNNRMSFIAARDENLAKSLYDAFMT